MFESGSKKKENGGKSGKKKVWCRNKYSIIGWNLSRNSESFDNSTLMIANKPFSQKKSFPNDSIWLEKELSSNSWK